MYGSRRFPAILVPAILVLAALPVAASDVTPDLEKALANQREITATRPTDSGAWSDLGNLLVLHDLFDEGEAAYLRAIGLDPRAVEPHFNLGLLYQRLANTEEAVSQFNQALEFDPANAWAHYQLGMVFEGMEKKQQKNRDLAIGHYARAFELDPKLSLHTSNPQVIDSKLTTEALLNAHSDRAGGSLAPMMFTERDPVADGLEEAPETVEPVVPLADSEDDGSN